MSHLRKFAVSALALIVLFLLTAAGHANDFKSPLKSLELKEGDSVVFLGDSITHQCLYTQYVEDYFYTRFPKMRLKLHNAGVGGARALDALDRFDRDVAQYKPKYVTVLLGMNDGTYQPYNEEVFRTYHKDMNTLLERLRGIDAVPVLMTPTMYDSRAARMGTRPTTPERLELYNSVLAYYGAWLREVAVESGFGYVDMWSPLNNITLQERKTDPAFTLIRDAVHPDAPGQLVMAYAIIDNLGLQRTVSSIRIDAGGKEAQKPNVQGGELADLKVSDDGVEFTWAADSLPLVVPEEAQLGAKLLHLGHRLSREALEVHGLAPGRYELSIDGEAVGTYSSQMLARHIELQENATTPQYKQALAVATLNKQRNDGPVRGMRDEWRKFQQFSRLKRQLDAGTADDKIKDQAADLEKQLAGLDDRIVAHEAAAKELEDEIFETNQPQPRKYVLKRVK